MNSVADLRLAGSADLNRLRELFDSPELYPMTLDPQRRVIRFVHMSPEAYRDSVFLDLRLRAAELDGYDFRLDDVLLTAASVSPAPRNVHYILNTGFCCSTLLARYFELIPSCFVLKEPRLLAQLVLMGQDCRIPWTSTLDLCLRFLARAYDPGQTVVIKPVECCNAIADLLLDQNDRATATFLMTPLRQFILALVKSGERRDWTQMRLAAVSREMRRCPTLAAVEIGSLGVAESAACLWLMHRYFCEQLCLSPHGHRLTVLNGQDLVDSPESAFPRVAQTCGLELSDAQLQELFKHPATRRYSKNMSRPYDADSRTKEICELERCWGAEADVGVRWAEEHGLESVATPQAMAWVA